MNKFKKLAVAAVSVVMAGTMALSFTACGGDDDKGGVGVDGAKNVLKADGTLDYSVYSGRQNVKLNVAVGHNSKTTSTSFLDLGAEIKLPNREQAYSDGDMKPAWAQMGSDLNITWEDKYEGVATNSNLNTLTSQNQTGTNTLKYDAVDLFTTDLSVAVSKAASGTDILNLADYLDVMPNFKKFLSENAIVYLSLLQDGMNTSNGSGQTIYVAPYFDGYDDIERYCIVRHDWVEKLLNGDAATDTTVTYASACANATAATSFMGKTGSYEVDALTADGSDVQKIKKDYGAAKTAAGAAGNALGDAYIAIAGSAYAGDSGNIVDIMNAAIAAKNTVTGSELVKLYRAYIDVCYKKGDNAYYTAANRANLFTGYDACWDVDDLVAMLRCVMTNPSALGKTAGNKIGGLAARSGQNDRTPDIVSLACQLYGVRGGTSRNEYNYIDNTGALKDAREDKAFYQAMDNMNKLVKEGLIADYSSIADFTTSSGVGTKKTAGNEYFMVYDYSQTQTLAGFVVEGKGKVTHDDFKNMSDEYYFAPVITPVSKWDVNADGSIAASEYFRFTESWRSTKTGGLAVNGAIKNDENKLNAALQFIDYLYSEDGQIVSTFGPMATKAADGKMSGGFWYNEKATDAEITAGKYFTYKGVKYSGYDYKGKITPTITEDLYKSFTGQTVNGWKVTDNDKVKGAKLSFTNYARMLIGSTLPVGVKDQSFENQLTSKMGQAGANRVGVALDKGVVKGMSLNIDSNNYWYTCVPSGLPVNASDQITLDSTDQVPFRYLTGTGKPDAKGSANKNFLSIMNWIVLNGTSSTYEQQDVNVAFTSIDDMLEKTIGGTKKVKELAAERRIAFNTAWTKAKSYWTYLSSKK